MWLSDGFNLMTGFATQTKELLKRYGQKGYDVHYVNSSYIGQKLKKVVYEDGEELNMTLLGGSPRAPYAKDLLQDYLYHYKPQLFGVLLDSFMLAENPAQPWILNLNIPCKSMFWFPSDGGWFPRNCEHVLRKFDMPVAMAKHGQQQVKETYGIDCEYVPHGVMTNLFFPLSDNAKMQNRLKWSQKLGVDISKKFVVGSVFRNQPRKFPDRLIKSFAKFSKDKDDVILLLHTEHADVAAPNDLLFLAQRFGCAHKIFFTGMKSFDAFPTTMMNEIYNLFDVHFLLSCIHPDMNVTTKGGVKKIKDIDCGDYVLTSAGEYRKVIATKPSDYSGQMLKINADGLPELKVTPNHKIHRIKCANPQDKERARKEKKAEIENAETLKKYDYLIYPIPKTTENFKEIETKKYIKQGRNQFGSIFTHKRVNSLPDKIILDYNFGLLCGYYLSEGVANQDGLAFCFHTKETDKYGLVEQILLNRFTTKTRLRHNTRNRTTLWCTGSQLGRMFIDLFGKGAHNKKLPEWILDSSKEFRLGLLEGVWKGDGSSWKSHEKGNVFELQTVSEQLSHGMFNLLIAEGFRPTLSSSQRQSKVWKVRLNGNQGFSGLINMADAIQTKKKMSRIWSDGINVYFPISKIETEFYEGLVYDLTVDSEHDFICHCLVKNSGEGFGIPIVEAMSCGIPNVWTAYTTTKELIMDNNAGFGVRLCDEKDEHTSARTEQLFSGTITGSWEVERGLASIYDAAEKLDRLYKEKNLREEFSKNARNAAVKLYDWDSVVFPKWELLTRRLL